MLFTGSWKPGDWSVCSKPCAGGQQSRKIQCVQKKPFQKEAAVVHSLCPVSTPTQVQVCNNHACPPEWSPGPWSQVTGSDLEPLVLFPMENEGDKNIGGAFAAQETLGCLHLQENHTDLMQRGILMFSVIFLCNLQFGTLRRPEIRGRLG